MDSQSYRDVTDNRVFWVSDKKGQGFSRTELGGGRQVVPDLSRVSQALFNRSNSFPASFCSNNEESYFVNFDQITAMGEDQLNPFVESIRDANTLFLDDNISFIGSKETDSYFDNTSKYQRSVTMDFSNNSKYPGICSYYPRNVNCIDYSRSNSDLARLLENKDELETYNTDNSLTRDSSGSSTEGTGHFIYGSSNGYIEYGNEGIIDSKHSHYCGPNMAGGRLPSPKRDRFMRQSDSLSSLTSDQLKDIGFINKQNNKRRSKRGYAPVKLFVNRVPKHMTNEELLKIFNKYGLVVECNIIRDSNGPKGCAFVRFSNIYEAQNAILCIHGKTVLDKEVGPIQVKYADGEIERLGLSPDVQPCGESVKVFVGSLPKNCTEDQLLLLFKQFGHVDEVHIIRDNNKQSKCSAFVTFPRKFMAENAIMFLDKKYIFDNSKRPIEVRLAKSRAKQKQQQQQQQQSQNANCRPNNSMSPNHSDFNTGNMGFGLSYNNKSYGSFGMQGMPLRGGTELFDPIPEVPPSHMQFSSIQGSHHNVDVAMQNFVIGHGLNHGHLSHQLGSHRHGNHSSHSKVTTNGISNTNTDISNTNTASPTNSSSKLNTNSSILIGTNSSMNNRLDSAPTVIHNMRNLEQQMNQELAGGPKRGMHMGPSHSSLISDSCHKGGPKNEDQIKFTPPTLLDFWAKPILNV
ncbi:bruno-like protein with 2 RRM domains [Cryptosporidium ubiquitum]|uniref:Bruno-like protein with 2 RRM domains n=1 Tax=Cryptosporidium ubiquitum TaxID=857276 RepID=A0A1J4MM52_9CRYT|nr:bruno-like protein with 2 RRM domains [Cryptosporidium ubiquitum]OII73949.1 bruno-like protein with 2 RRM domains [Cryptosporidium ubiquitum]